MIRNLLSLFLAVVIALVAGAVSPARSQSLDELHKSALKEGALNFYATLAQINAEIVLPAFEKRFPGIKINHVDATSDQLVARAMSEARGGRTLGDVFQVPLENVVQLHDQGLLLDTSFPNRPPTRMDLREPFGPLPTCSISSRRGIPIR